MSVEQAKRTQFEALGNFSLIQLVAMIAAKKYSADDIAAAASWYRSQTSEKVDTGALFKALILESLWFIMMDQAGSGASAQSFKSTVFRELPHYLK
jgi:hypothetical protein